MTMPINATGSMLSLTAQGSDKVRSLSAAAGSKSGAMYNDFNDIAKLKTQSREDPKAALHEVAHQFESLFTTMMLKAMRDTLPKDGLFASSAMESYQGMFDQQLALDLSRHGSMGLANVIERQLSNTIAPSVHSAKSE